MKPAEQGHHAENLNSFVLFLLSVAAYAVAGSIVWPQALWMMALATDGDWASVRLAKRLPVRWVRWLVMGTGLLLSVVFFMRTGSARPAHPIQRLAAGAAESSNRAGPQPKSFAINCAKR